DYYCSSYAGSATLLF
nr:immunoglobulin light chain junction region [Macaca mulatta]